VITSLLGAPVGCPVFSPLCIGDGRNPLTSRAWHRPLYESTPPLSITTLLTISHSHSPPANFRSGRPVPRTPRRGTHIGFFFHLGLEGRSGQCPPLCRPGWMCRNSSLVCKRPLFFFFSFFAGLPLALVEVGTFLF